MPKGVTVTFQKGKATLAGKPKKPGTYDLTFKATYGAGKNKQVIIQAFALTVS